MGAEARSRLRLGLGLRLGLALEPPMSFLRRAPQIIILITRSRKRASDFSPNERSSPAHLSMCCQYSEHKEVRERAEQIAFPAARVEMTGRREAKAELEAARRGTGTAGYTAGGRRDVGGVAPVWVREAVWRDVAWSAVFATTVGKERGCLELRVAR